MRTHKKYTPQYWAALVLVLIAALVSVVPFVYMVLVSFTQMEILSFNFDFSEFSLVNYSTVFRNLDFMTNLKNSVIVTVITCILNCIIPSMAAYAFAKKQFPGKSKFFMVYLATLMIPSQVTLIPMFFIVRALGLMNTYTAMILPLINAFGVFLIKQFLDSFPDELLEAGRIDGCGENRMFVTIVVPLMKSVLVSLVIFTFITSWNNFLWPLVIASKPNVQTLTVALATLKSNYSTNYGLVMAGSTLAFLPPFIIYIFLQRQFVEGIALSGIKG